MTGLTLKHLKARSQYLIIPIALVIMTIWLINTPPGLLGKADGIGYAVCHRIDERSLQIGDRQLPLCARCSGMYLGAIAGLIFQAAVGWKKQNFPPWSVAIPLILLAILFAIDGANSYLYLMKSIVPGRMASIPNLYVPNNTLRVLTGSGMGLGLAAILYPAFNQSVWTEPVEKPALNIKGFLPLLGIILLIDLLALSGSPIVLYPAAFISAGTVIILLTMVYCIVWIMITGQDNKFSRFRQLWLPVLAGLTITFIQILAIDLLRLWLTGSWGEIPLG